MGTLWVHDGVPSGYLKGVGGGEMGDPPRGSKSYTIVKTLNPQKFFDFESIKFFLRVMDLENFQSPLLDT